MGEIRHEQESQDPLEREGQFRERMEQLVPTFLEIREKMGAGEDVGFAYLPEVIEGGISSGSLPRISRKKNGRIECDSMGFFMSVSKKELPEEREKDIFVMPKDSARKKRVVSIADPFDEYYEGPKLLEASDDVFVGLIAHELAHSYNTKTKFPPEIRAVLEKRYKDNDPDSKYKWQYDTHDEEEMDVLAALFGYKDQVVARLDFMLDRMSRMAPHFRNKDYIIKGLEARKQQVLKYCP